MTRRGVIETINWNAADTLTALESAELDRLSESAGMPVRDLMEFAGWQCARWIAAQCGDPTNHGPHIGIIVGLGNNGGDGLVAARYLFDWGYSVEVMCMGEESRMKTLPHEHLVRARHEGIRVEDVLATEHELQSMFMGGILVDAILGTGSVLPLRSEVAHACRLLNKMHARHLAIDAPTGVDSTTGDRDADAFRADATLCLAAPKSGCGVTDCWGTVYVADLPIPQSAWKALGKTRPVDRGRIVQLVISR